MWQEGSGAPRRLTGRCLDLSSEGARIETKDRLSPGTTVTVSSNEFGRMGHSVVRYCRRDAMRYLIGLKFGAPFGLGDPARQKILAHVLNAAAPGHKHEPNT